MTTVKHLTTEELESGLAGIRQSPKDHGVLKLLVRRPREGEREILDEGLLDLIHGLMGDNWKTRGSSSTPDRSAHPDQQLNIMNFRAINLVAGDKERWPVISCTWTWISARTTCRPALDWPSARQSSKLRQSRITAAKSFVPVLDWQP